MSKLLRRRNSEAFDSLLREIGSTFCDEKLTVRTCAERFGYSKSTIHKWLRKDIKYVNFGLFCEVEEILEENKAQRHIRGGEATKKKYKHVA